MENSLGMVFNIQNFCINDGPGIRTTVFLKGCPLNCLWCHNPESKKSSTEILFMKEKCINCKKCMHLCQNSCHEFNEKGHTFNRDNCINCKKCLNSFCTALELCGNEMTALQVVNEVIKDKAFYDNSGGGVTLSGGEPLYQFEFAKSIFALSKTNNIHTCVETSGFIKSEKLMDISKYIDLFLFDFKETSPILHKKYTNVDNSIILQNLNLLNIINKSVILRCPIIPNINDRRDHFDKIAKIANINSNIIEVNIEPYHPLGISKSEQLGIESLFSTNKFYENDKIDKIISYISKICEKPIKRA